MIYKSDSKDFLELVKKDPNVFSEVGPGCDAKEIPADWTRPSIIRDSVAK